MSLTCQNCGSTDVVTIQGQNFCINCGQMVKGETGAAPKPKAPVKPPKVVATAVEIPVTKKVPKIIHAPKEEKVEAPTVISHIAPTPYETQRQAKKKADEEQPVTQMAPRVVNRPKPKPMAEPSKSLDPVYAQAALPAAAREKAPATEPEFEDIRPHPLAFTLRIAAAVAAPIGVITALLIGFHVDRDIAWYWIGGLVVLFGTAALLAQAALLYGLSRNQDGRPTQQQRWWAAARSGFLEVVNVDIAMLITLTLALIGWVAIWRLGDGLAGQAAALRWVVLGMLNLVAAWVTLGALASRHIAIPAVVIGGITSTEAVKLGWQAYLKAGGHLVLALAEALVARMATVVILAVLAVGGGVIAEHLAPALVAALGGAGVAIAAGAMLVLLLQVEVRVWLKQYRYWINLYFPEQRLRLLSGRLHSASRR